MSLVIKDRTLKLPSIHFALYFVCNIQICLLESFVTQFTLLQDFSALTLCARRR